MNLTLTPVRFKERAVTEYGSKIGIVDGDKRFTYREYGERCDRLSNALTTLGVGRGERVAWLGYNSHQLLEAYYGVVQIGAVLLPLNIRLTPHEITYILNDSESVVLFYNKDFALLVDALKDNVLTIKHFICIEGQYEALLEEAAADFMPPADLRDDDLAELFYTSGTTANPKGVMMTHRNLYLHAMQVIGGIGIRDHHVQLHTIPLFHVNGWGTPHTLTCMGARHIVVPKFDPAEVLELIQREQVTHIAVVPTMAYALLNHPKLNDYNLHSLEFINIGGAASGPSLIREIEERIGCRAYAGYGMTETTPVLTLSFLKDHLKNLPDEERWRRQAMTGYPMPGVTMDVFDA